MTSELRSDRRASTLVLTMCGTAGGNSLTPQTCAAGIEALSVAEADPDVSLVVISGDAGCFCGGEPMSHRTESPGRSGGVPFPAVDALHAWIDGLRAFPKPVVAAVEGVAADAGLALALACDVVVAAEDARFVVSGAAAGHTPVAGLSWHLGHRLPRSLALPWLWLGADVEAREMKDRGLVATLTQHGAALDEALRMGERLADVRPAALAAVKGLIDASLENPLTRQLDRERICLVEMLAGRPSRRIGGAA